MHGQSSYRFLRLLRRAPHREHQHHPPTSNLPLAELEFRVPSHPSIQHNMLEYFETEYILLGKVQKVRLQRPHSRLYLVPSGGNLNYPVAFDLELFCNS